MGYDKWVYIDALYPNAQVTNVELVVRVTRLFWIVFLALSCTIPPGCTRTWRYIAFVYYTGLMILSIGLYMIIWVYALPSWCEDAHNEVDYYMVRYFPVDTILFLSIYTLYLIPLCISEVISCIKRWLEYYSPHPNPTSFPI